MGEKQRVISTLRVLLACSGRKAATPLHELTYDYCVLECTNQIPCFEHKSVIDFLMSSGEFAVNVENTGSVTVIGKPKSLSSHLKKKMVDSLVVEAVYDTTCKKQNHEPLSVNEMEMAQWNFSTENIHRLAVNVKIEVGPSSDLPGDTLELPALFTMNQLGDQLNDIIETKNKPDQEQFATVNRSTEATEEIVTSSHNVNTTDSEENTDILSEQSSKDKYSSCQDVTTVLPEECVVKPTPESHLETKQLMSHPIPDRILEIERNENVSSDSMNWIKAWISQKILFRVFQDIYIEAFRTMIFFEEAVELLEIEAHNFPAVELLATDYNEFYFDISSDFNKIDNLMAAIDENKLNRFTLTPSGALIPKRIRKRIPSLLGRVKRRAGNKIFVRILCAQDWRSGVKYNIHFEVNQLNSQIQHNALDFIEMHGLFPVLINNPLYRRRNSDEPANQCTDKFTKDRSDLNPEQKQAIEFIIAGGYNPVPYLLYGPPGTGKTKTIVAAIETIVRETSKNVLVCAHSNAACNEITERLAKVLTNVEMLRMFSVSHRKADITPTIEPFSNLFDGQIDYPELSYLYKFRVLICTLSVSGCLAKAHNSNPRHFGYVFIDECASACETMALVPIAGLCTSKDTVHANVVLAGDPKQLDAVTRSDWSTKLGFETSWFERLFDKALYKRHSGTGQFNAKYITQLTRNYRSHEAILRIPNEIFYDNSLKAVTVPDFINLDMCGLKSTNFPIIFQSVHGFCNKPDDSTSLFNSLEVNHVLEFVEMLMGSEKYNLNQHDIGIVSPYKLQCNMIRRRCQQIGYRHIAIGSTEQFQGQERKIIIISTVRSGSSRLGDFVKNPQRFNVMITRAKSLLIVVGNPHLLSQDKNWAKFIDFCLQNGSLIQDSTQYFLSSRNDTDDSEST